MLATEDDADDDDARAISITGALYNGRPVSAHMQTASDAWHGPWSEITPHDPDPDGNVGETLLAYARAVKLGL